ncbi:MAG: hypothetical protein AAF568_08120 [Pseudomonadota bacterium]
MKIFALRHLIAAALLSVIGTAEASALTFYRTTVDFIPSPRFSNDPADGDQVVIDWSTTQTSGFIVATDLVDLRFRLFGQGVLLFDDPFLVNSVVQPIGGVSRSGIVLGGSTFSFSLDEFSADPSTGLRFFDNDIPVVQSSASGVTYNLIDGFNFRYENGVVNDAASTEYEFLRSTTTQSTVITSAIPLPAGLPLLLGGLAVLGLTVRVRGQRKALT